MAAPGLVLEQPVRGFPDYRTLLGGRLGAYPALQ